MDILLEKTLWYLTFLFSVTFHEAAHAWAAMRGGDLTAYHGGQVSLDPVPHIKREPFGMVVLPIISLFYGYQWPFGFASTPYDPIWAAHNERLAALMSIAGPASNMLLVIAAGLAIWAGILGKVFINPGITGAEQVVEAVGPGAWVIPAKVVGMFFVLNLGLTVLNLIPLPPLDGSGAMPLVLQGNALSAYRRFAENPSLRIVGLFAAWYLFAPIFRVVFVAALRVLYPWAGYG
jgi:Zn-dependent protease